MERNKLINGDMRIDDRFIGDAGDVNVPELNAGGWAKIERDFYIPFWMCIKLAFFRRSLRVSFNFKSDAEFTGVQVYEAKGMPITAHQKQPFKLPFFSAEL